MWLMFYIKRYKENSRLENYEITLARINLMLSCGGYLLALYLQPISNTGIFCG